MAYNPIQDWVDGCDDEPGPEEKLLLSPWERSADPKRPGKQISGTPSRNADAKHGRGYVLDSEDDRRTSDDGLADALAATMLGVWFAIPIIKSVVRWTVFVTIVTVILWILE